ncbi:hypothetical protein [Psychroserpens sp.]|uniref:hypothetical protein n=1 Tax=Psychroserpens sp. TaxID=2020870 RepID=UPI001B1143A2|nr:hypothetical protein [Psychroserpens sp.]MBO6607023.1 hypothetical protein [Psychroserpens sp.]MBO6631472.1 hypothetical protein [Psychroserpens sp.]MBO6654169.1 hypothetical protein [Psychroserpens sp.]MBO6682545.1 hypothetical protein [Psychroserpens sp.]MBO6750795.1 hypothetical protein [Psychroserpens sp.]
MSKKTTNSNRKWKVNWTTDKIMSTSALFISVISLIALLYQSYLAREENKLNQMQQSASVLPHLNQWFSDYNDEFKIIIGNKGVGPAFIKEVEFKLDSTNTFNNSKDLIKYIFRNKKILESVPYVQSTIVKGFVLPANDFINVIEVSGQDNINRFKQVMASTPIIFKIVYEDVYGTRWMLSNTEGETNIPFQLE